MDIEDHDYLDVIVETAIFVAVHIQQRHGLTGLEVLELHDHLGPAVKHCLHELVHEVEVFLSLDSRGAQPDVVLVLLQTQVVRAHIQADRQYTMRSYTIEFT